MANTLRTVALLGPGIDLDLLAGVLKQPALELLTHLEEGVRRRLLVEEGSTFVFRHELIREALSAQAGTMRRALVHREAGRLLASRPGTDPLEVAHHARLAGDSELAAKSLSQAAARAAARYDHAESLRLLDQALTLWDSSDLRLQRSRGRILLEDYVGAEEDALAAWHDGAGAAAFEAAGWAAYYKRDLPGAERYAREALLVAGEDTQSGCLSLLGRTLSVQSRLDDSEKALEEALASAREPLTRAAAAVWLSNLRVWQGRPAEALELAQPARRLVHGGSIQRLNIYACWTTSYALATLGRADEALHALDLWELEMDRQHISRFRHRPGNFRAWVLRGLGDLDSADGLNQDIAARYQGDEVTHALLDLVEGRLIAGDPDGAVRYLEAVPPSLDRSAMVRARMRIRWLYLQARLALDMGQPEAALARAEEAHSEAAAAGIIRYRGLAYAARARAAAMLGRPLDLAEVHDVLRALPGHAGLESWRVSADFAETTRLPVFLALAEQQAEDVATRAGERASAFRRYAGRRLDMVRMRGRQGV